MEYEISVGHEAFRVSSEVSKRIRESGLIEMAYHYNDNHYKSVFSCAGRVVATKNYSKRILIEAILFRMMVDFSFVISSERINVKELIYNRDSIKLTPISTN